MSEKKYEILAFMGKAMPGMTETERSYLIGFLEGFAARPETSRPQQERVGA